MNCLALLAHCRRTRNRIQLLHHENDSNVHVRVANVMESSLYDRSPVRRVIKPDAMRELLLAFHGGGSNGAATNKCCPITQSEFSEGDTVLVLPCGHAFMKDAIQTWLETESAECPVCRHALPSHEIIIM